MTTTVHPLTQSIDARELDRRRADDPQIRLLDVRTGGEFETMHIAGSYNVPLDTLAEHLDELADIDQPVVLVCRSGNRAGTAHRQLQAAGKQSLMILEGGIDRWLADGGEVVRGTVERWAMDRQVRLTAGSMVLASVVASLALPRAKWLAAGVGAGLTWSAVSDTCAMAAVLGRLPYNRTPDCDIEGVLSDLRAQAA